MIGRMGWGVAGIAALTLVGLWQWSASTGAPQRLPATPQRPAMVPIAAGTFTMGSPADEVGRFASEPQRPIRLTRGFWMAATEVTQDQYAAVTGLEPSRFRGQPGDGERPVERVSWFDAVRYCNALSRAEGLAPAYRVEGDSVAWDRDALGYRLPTAAEWEYAARAGSTTATYAGDLSLDGSIDAPELHAIAWFAPNSASQHPQAYIPDAHMLTAGWSTPLSTQPVGTRQANAWGVHDMLGNVFEWVWDRTGPSADAIDGQPVVDPVGPAEGPGRAIRGGAFRDAARVVRAAARGGGIASSASEVVGFRPVRNLPRVR